MQQQQLGYAVDGGESEDEKQKIETTHNKNNNQTDYVTGVLLRVTMVDQEWSGDGDGDGGYGRRCCVVCGDVLCALLFAFLQRGTYLGVCRHFCRQILW